MAKFKVFLKRAVVLSLLATSVFAFNFKSAYAFSIDDAMSVVYREYGLSLIHI